LPKPKGTLGGTKMKIMAIICHNCEKGSDSYGYTIWQSLKDVFHIYLNDCDVRNVYHHLKELCEIEQGRYAPYLEVLRQASSPPSKY